MKDYLEYENARNKSAAGLFETMLRIAFTDCQVMVGHHISMEFKGDLATENEIPSADTLIFDHPIMTRIFGEYAVPLMQHLAAIPCHEREAAVREALAQADLPRVA
jgi:hypothetical protein